MLRRRCASRRCRQCAVRRIVPPARCPARPALFPQRCAVRRLAGRGARSACHTPCRPCSWVMATSLLEAPDWATCLFCPSGAGNVDQHEDRGVPSTHGNVGSTSVMPRGWRPRTPVPGAAAVCPRHRILGCPARQPEHTHGRGCGAYRGGVATLRDMTLCPNILRCSGNWCGGRIVP